MSLSINVKKIFLSFVQKYYAEDPIFTWVPDPRVTKIFIADKYALDTAAVEKIPSIILNLGGRTWVQSSMDQRLTTDLTRNVTERTDLLRCSITYHVISKNGIEAETIADGLLLRIMAFKGEFRKKKIHQIISSSIGEEQIIRGDASARMIMVPVYVQFTVQAGTQFEEDINTLHVWENETLVYEFIDYIVSGNSIGFFSPPASGLAMTATYTGRYTLTNYNNVALAPPYSDGVNYTFYTDEAIFAQYPLLSGISINEIIA